MDKFLEFLEKHWQGIFVVLSIIGLLISILGGFKISTSIVWGLVLIAAIITINDGWETLFSHLGNLFWKLLCGWGNIAVGGKGLTAMLFTNGGTLFLLGFLAVSAGGKGGTIVAAFGVAMVVGGLLSIPAKAIYDKRQ